MNNKGRYHNDYSPRYQDAFDIYEKAKNHAKEQRKKERLHSLSVVEQEHRNRSGDDNTISNKTPHVRNLSKKQKSKDGGEDNLLVIIDGNFSCRCTGIGSSNCELASACK